MDSYTITITPDDDSGNSTTLTVDTSTGQARITSVHMQAPAGLTGAQMPSVDVELLLQAVTSHAHTPAALTADVTPAAPQPAPTDTDIDTDTDTDTDEPAATGVTAAPQSATGDTAAQATPAKRTGRRAAAGARVAESAPAASSGARRRRNEPAPTKAIPRKAALRKAAPAKTTGRKAPAPVAASSVERAYRRMPDDFAAVYQQVGTTAAIAEHYGVPRHTAQGWIGRHKKQNAAAN
jgi:hypothetical protein